MFFVIDMKNITLRQKAINQGISTMIRCLGYEHWKICLCTINLHRKLSARPTIGMRIHISTSQPNQLRSSFAFGK